MSDNDKYKAQKSMVSCNFSTANNNWNRQQGKNDNDTIRPKSAAA